MSVIQHLGCFQLTNRFANQFPRNLAPDPPALLLPLPVFGSSNLIHYLDSFFASISLQSNWPETKHDFIACFPRFLFLYVGRDV
jgi:hypothetical protein